MKMRPFLKENNGQSGIIETKQMQTVMSSEQAVCRLGAVLYLHYKV